MTQCELCGNDEKNLLEAKISGAVLNVCPDCTKHGTITDEQKEEENKSDTKYSTTKNNNKTNKSNSRNKSGNYNKNTEDDTDDYFDSVNDLSLNYGEKIQNARNSKGYTREELAKKMNIKESNLRNIEDEKTQPVIDLQKRLENMLDIDLSVEDIDY